MSRKSRCRSSWCFRVLCEAFLGSQLCPGNHQIVRGHVSGDAYTPLGERHRGMSFEYTLKLPDSFDGGRSNGESRSDLSPWLFLSLYLLLFAFFIVLNSFSSFDRGRRDAVIDSVLVAFTADTTPGPEQALIGLIDLQQQARRFQEAITDIFETAIPLANLSVVDPGTRVEVDVPTQAWFQGESVVVRDPLPMLDRIVTTVSSPPSGMSYEMILVAQIGEDETVPIPQGMTPDVARIGNIARALDAKGMPPRSLSIGLQHGDPRFFKVIFLAVENSGYATPISGSEIG